MPIETAPGIDETSQTPRQLPAYALVCLWCRQEPHRAGEIAFLPAFEPRFLGRGGVAGVLYLYFGRQVPGVPLSPTPSDVCVPGDSISAVQARVTATAVGIEMEKVGKCVTLVSGVEQDKATLVEGNTLMFRGEAAFLCVSRLRVMPALQYAIASHPFGEPDASGAVGESPAAWQLRDDVARAAAGKRHVLVRGESGTGKEAVSRSIHKGSDRANGRFVALTLGVSTSTLIESKFFGNVANYPARGDVARNGAFGDADGGTLYCDEIGECPRDVQAALLRALGEGEYTPLGESMPRRVNVRVVGATWQDDSRFRPDFLARLEGRVQVPAVRDRREDIPLLIRHVLLQLAKEDPKYARFLERGPSGDLYPRISGRLVDYLVRHPLGTNVRQLRALVTAAAERSLGDTVEMPDTDVMTAPASAQPASRAPEPTKTKNAKAKPEKAPAPTREQVLAALERAGWNASRAAQHLGMARSTLYLRMEKYGIEPKEPTLT